MDNKKIDKEIDQYLNNIIKSNYNGFASNNNNPFLVSPYAPPANMVTTSQIVTINTSITIINQNLSTLFDLNTLTLKISTITNTLDSDIVRFSTVNLIMDTPYLEINAISTGINGDVYFPDSTFSNYAR
jgi:hypothetical protein